MAKLLAKYSWKTKTRALIALSVFFGFFCYQLALKPTIQARAAYTNQHHNQNMLTSVRDRIANLKKQTGVAETGFQQLEGRASEKELMVALAGDQKVMVKNLTEEATTLENGKKVTYNAYYFSAPFTELLLLLNHAENENSLNILNVRFYTEENPQTKQRELVMKLETATIKEI